MREAFTQTLRHALAVAQGEARRHNQEFVSTEILFLGVIKCHDCEAERILRQAHLDSAVLRQVLSRDLPTASESPLITGDLPLTPKAQRAIQGAIVKAQALREQRISTRHLLLSLLDEVQSLVREAIADSGSDVNVLRHALVEAPPDEET
jgi:ATP-dependent Clp protease ATP-binding subunit ClpA